MKGIPLFIRCAGLILLAAALERFLVALGHAQFLSLPEPVMGIPLHYAVLVVGLFEWIVAMICLFGQRPGLQLGWLAWASTNYWVYRIGLLTMEVHQQGTCIGSLTDPLRLTCGSFGEIIGALPWCLLLGSYAAVAWFWQGERMWARHLKEKAESIKMACPACGTHIKFASPFLGRKIACPQCLKIITLRRPENLRMSCFFCQEHIEFPSHAIGEKMPCPHCKMDITLKEPT